MVAASPNPALSENDLFRAHSAGRGADPAHVPVPHELRNAWETAKQLEERLEIANQPELRQLALYVREQVFAALMRAEGYVEVRVEEAGSIEA